MQIDTDTSTAAEQIYVAIPAKPEYVGIARLTTAAVAARQGFPYDAIEDLKVAISEACGALIAAAGRSRRPLSLHFLPERHALTVRVASQGTVLEEVDARWTKGLQAPDESTLGLFLMRCLVDEVDIRHANGESSITLRLAKQQQGRPDAGSTRPQQD